MKHSKSSILLMEMIICIFFFALCAVVSSQVFVQAHLLSKNTISENHASIVLESLAESFYASNGDINAIANNYPDYASTSANDLTLYMDKDFQFLTASEVTADNYTYYALLSVTPDNYSETMTGTATFYSVDASLDGNGSDKEIYSIDLVANIPNFINH